MFPFFDPYANPVPFGLFDAYHLGALATLLVVNLLMVFYLRRRPEHRRAARLGLTALLVFNIVLWQAWHYSWGLWDIRYMLPLHMCGVMVWTSAVMLVTRNYNLYEFVYFLGLGGATQALITPDSGGYGFPHFRFLETFVSHGGIVTAAILMTFVEGFRPTWASVRRVIIVTQIYAIVVFVINQVLGSNYLFIAHKPSVPTLIDLLPAWPYYLIILELLALAVIGLLYLPWAIADWRRKEQDVPMVSA